MTNRKTTMWCSACGIIDYDDDHFVGFGDEALKLYVKTYPIAIWLNVCWYSTNQINTIIDDIKEFTGRRIMFSYPHGFETIGDIKDGRKFRAGNQLN
jgi:hypothetical protein